MLCLVIYDAGGIATALPVPIRDSCAFVCSRPRKANRTLSTTSNEKKEEDTKGQVCVIVIYALEMLRASVHEQRF